MEKEKEEEKDLRAVITVVGIDRVGIIARITGKLAALSINILDISQTIMGDLFTMSMIVDMAKGEKPFVEARDELVALGQEMGMEIHVQREDVFRYMHRI
ncbi:MAG: ACT domain-containing protein [Deltaproteobacteria bacterium]|nr:ACT domain-containing protein [Deltaproteobacteria bacterium]